MIKPDQESSDTMNIMALVSRWNCGVFWENNGKSTISGEKSCAVVSKNVSWQSDDQEQSDD